MVSGMRPLWFFNTALAKFVEVSTKPGLYGSGEDSGAGGLSEDAASYAPQVRNRRRKRWQKRKSDSEVSGAAKNNGEMKIGQRIFHQKFGYGKIKSSDGDKLEIEFEKAGTKKVMSSFVEAA